MRCTIPGFHLVRRGRSSAGSLDHGPTWVSRWVRLPLRTPSCLVPRRVPVFNPSTLVLCHSFLHSPF